MMLCRRCFSDNAVKIGFNKVRSLLLSSRVHLWPEDFFLSLFSLLFFLLSFLSPQYR